MVIESRLLLEVNIVGRRTSTVSPSRGSRMEQRTMRFLPKEAPPGIAPGTPLSLNSDVWSKRLAKQNKPHRVFASEDCTLVRLTRVHYLHCAAICFFLARLPNPDLRIFEKVDPGKSFEILARSTGAHVFP